MTDARPFCPECGAECEPTDDLRIWTCQVAPGFKVEVDIDETVTEEWYDKYGTPRHRRKVVSTEGSH